MFLDPDLRFQKQKLFIDSNLLKNRKTLLILEKGLFLESVFRDNSKNRPVLGSIFSGSIAELRSRTFLI